MSWPTYTRSWNGPARRLIVVFLAMGVASRALFAGGGLELETRAASSAGGEGSGGRITALEPAQAQRVVRFYADAHDIASIALSPDGIWAVSADDREVLRIWHVPTHRLVVTRRVFPKDSIMGSVRFSPDGRSLLVSSRSAAQMLAVDTWLTRWRVEAPYAGRKGIAFSSDSEIVAIPVRGDDGSAAVEIRDVETGEVIEKLDLTLGRIEVVLLGPHGDQIFVAGYNDPQGKPPIVHSARLWNWKSGRESLRMDSRVESAAWDRKRGRLFICQGGHAIDEWDIPSGRKLRHWHLDSETSCRSIALADDGRLMVLGFRGAVELWDAYGAKRLDRVLMPHLNLHELAPREDGRFVLVQDWNAKMFWGIRFPSPSDDTQPETLADAATETTDARTETISESSAPSPASAGTVQKLEERVSQLEQGDQSERSELKNAITKLSRQLERIEASSAEDAVRGGERPAAPATPASSGSAQSPQKQLSRGGIVPFEIKKFAYHDYAITGMTLSPDDRWLATTTLGGPVRVWSVDHHSQPAKIDVSKMRGQFDVAFSPDGKLLAVASTKSVKVVSTSDWTTQWTKPVLGLHSGTYVQVAFSQDGKQLALAGKYLLEVWDVETREFLHKSKHEFLGIGAFQFNDSSDEVMLVGSSSLPGGASQMFQILGWKDGYRRSLIANGPLNELRDVAWDTEHNTLYALRKDGIEQWNTHSGRKIREWPGTAKITEIALSGDGRFLAAGTVYGTVELWETSSMQRIESLPVDLPRINFLALSSDGTQFYAAVRGDYTMRRGTFRMPGVLDPEEIDALTQKKVLRMPTMYHRVFNLAPNRIVKGPGFAIRSFALAPDGETAFLSTSRRGLDHWDLRSGKSLLDPLRPQHNRRLRDVTCLPDGKTLAFIIPRQRAIVLWDVESWQPIKTLRSHLPYSPFSLAVSPDGKIAAVGRGPSIVLWNLVTGQQIRKFPTNARSWDLGISSDKRFVAARGLHALRVWSAKTGEKLFEIRAFRREHSPWYRLSFSPTTPVRLLVAGENLSWRSLEHWNLGRPVKSLYGMDERFRSAVFSPDGTKILAVGPDRAYLFDTETFEELLSVPCAPSRAEVAQFTPDGSQFITMSKRGSFVFWPVPGWEEAADAEEPSTPVVAPRPVERD